MRVSKIICICAVMGVFMPMCVFAHGTLGSVDRTGGVLISASYDDGDPMSYTEVTILFEGEDIPFQTGRTDRNGRFMIFPEDAGNYKAVIKDGMGHGLSLLIASDEGAGIETSLLNTRPRSRIPGLLAGLTAIFFSCGLGFWWAGKKGRANAVDLRKRAKE